MTAKIPVNREMVIETAALMVDESGGISSVTLREIAKRIGCAHTNLYNYFSSLSEIYWEVLGWVLRKMFVYTNLHGEEGDHEANLFRSFSLFVDFSIDHPGWYRLIWHENWGGEPPAHVAEFIQRPADHIYAATRMAVGSSFPEDKTRQLAEMLFAYSFGEISIWVHDRSTLRSRNELKENIDRNIRSIYSFMTEKQELAGFSKNINN